MTIKIKVDTQSHSGFECPQCQQKQLLIDEYARTEAKDKKYIAELKVELAEMKALCDPEFYVPMPANREYKLKVRIISVEKAEPNTDKEQPIVKSEPLPMGCIVHKGGRK